MDLSGADEGDAVEGANGGTINSRALIEIKPVSRNTNYG